MKSAGKRSRLRLTCSFKRFIVTPELGEIRIEHHLVTLNWEDARFDSLKRYNCTRFWLSPHFEVANCDHLTLIPAYSFRLDFLLPYFFKNFSAISPEIG